jgi:hypothetical protein
MDTQEVRRRLFQPHKAKVRRQPQHAFWQLSHAPVIATDALERVQPSTAPLPDTALRMEDLHSRTQQVVLLHTYSPITGERLSITPASAHDADLRCELAVSPAAADRLRQAPLDTDTPGQVMLANLAGQDASLPEHLQRIRSPQIAPTASPLADWALISVPLRRLPGAPAITGAEPRVVAAVSITRDPMAGNPLIAYRRLMCNAVQAATQTSVVIPHTRFAAAQTARPGLKAQRSVASHAAAVQ